MRSLPVACLLMFAATGESAATRAIPAPESLRFTLADAARGAPIPLLVVLPADGGPHPVIVFSHGSEGSRETAASLADGWARRGHAVVAPSHDDGRSSASFPPGSHEGSIAHRVRDLTTILDALPALGRPALEGRLDATRIGLAGHSLGAVTVAALMGARTGLVEGVRTPDPRPLGFMLLSPQGPGRFGFTDASWAGMTRPLMLMTAGRDSGPGGEPASWREAPFRGAGSQEAYLLVLHEAEHMSFVDWIGDEAPPPDLTPARRDDVWRRIRDASAAFWDAVLTRSPAARQWLQGGGPAAEGGGQVRFEVTGGGAAAPAR